MPLFLAETSKHHHDDPAPRQPKIQSEGVAFYRRFLDERLAEFKSRFDELLGVLAEHDKQKKHTAARAALAAIRDLQRGTSAEDQPSWLAPLEKSLATYVNGPGRANAGVQLLRTIIRFAPSVREHEWNIEGVQPVDFDAVYKRYYDESRVPELFETLIEKLEEIVSSGYVDSLQAINALQKIITTMRRNIRGSYFSTRGSYEFAAVLLDNLLWSMLKKIPALGTILEAVEATFEELDAEMAAVHDKTNQELARQAKAGLPMLEYTPGAVPALKAGDAPPEE